MDSTIVNPVLSQDQQYYVLAITGIVTFILPYVVNLLNKWKLIDSLPTNVVTVILSVIVAFVLSLVAFPELTIKDTIMILTVMFGGATLWGRFAPMKKPNHQ